MLIVVVLALLYAGCNLLIPLVVALFIWYLVNIIAISYSSRSVFGKHLPKWLAYILSGVTILLLAQGLGSLVTGNIAQVIDMAPNYQEKLVRQFRVLLENFSIEHGQALTEYFASLELGDMLTVLDKNMASLIGDFWALLIFVLNFIPNIGSIVATILPSLLALVQFDSLTPFLIVLFGIGTIQFVIGNILEPNLMGHRLNISPLVIVLSLVLWGYLWGVPGLFLGVPMMVILIIVLYHFEDTRWVVMLSRDGKLRD